MSHTAIAGATRQHSDGGSTPNDAPPIPTAPQAPPETGSLVWLGRVRHVSAVLLRQSDQRARPAVRRRRRGTLRAAALPHPDRGSRRQLREVRAGAGGPTGSAAARLRDGAARPARSRRACPHRLVIQTLHEELGDAARRLASFNREPLATASIAQVHVAELDGRRVASKCSARGLNDSSVPTCG